jgi:probable rRNA maturation factor
VPQQRSAGGEPGSGAEAVSGGARRGTSPGAPRRPFDRVVEITALPGVPRLLSSGTLRGVARRALEAAGAPPLAIVELTLADDDELARLNEAHMGATGPTDVLSFPLLEPTAFPPHAGGPSEQPGLAGSTTAFVAPPGELVHLGAIVVSVERAVAQARDGRGGQTGDVRWSPADELRLLVTHGVLHLCGWDHARPEEEATMRALERALLAAQGVAGRP